MRLSAVIQIAFWEIKQAFRSRSFLFLMIVVPFIFRIFINPVEVRHSSANISPKIICVIDGAFDDNPFYKTLQGDGALPEFIFINGNTQNDSARFSRESSLSMLHSGKYDALLYVNQGKIKSEMVASGNFTALDYRRLQDYFVNTAEHQIKDGRTAEQFRNLRGSVLTRVVESRRYNTGEFENLLLAGVFLSIIFFNAISFLGNWFIRSFAEEKNNKLLDILISICSPSELIAGKFFGITMMGIIQMAGLLLTAFISLPSFISAAGSLNNMLILGFGFSLSILLYALFSMLIGLLNLSDKAGQALVSIMALLYLLPLAAALNGGGQEIFSRIFAYVPFFFPVQLIFKTILSQVGTGEILTAVSVHVLFILLVAAVLAKKLKHGFES